MDLIESNWARASRRTRKKKREGAAHDGGYQAAIDEVPNDTPVVALKRALVVRCALVDPNLVDHHKELER